MNENKKIYIIGIGGVGMSAIANIFNDLGYNVSGSDKTHTIYIDLLPNTIKVNYGYKISNVICIDKSTIILSSDVNDNTNVELNYCINNNFNLITRYEILQMLSNDKVSVGITGSHGKSTTSCLCAHLLDSSFMLGAIPKNYNINGRYDNTSKNKYFVFELDESNKQFSTIKTNNMIVTNINDDHVELYENEENLQEHFNKLESNTNNLIYCGDKISTNKNLVLKYNTGVSYGFESSNTYIISNYKSIEYANFITFDIVGNNITYSNIKINLLGQHNALNACAVFLLGISLGLNSEEIKKKFESFKGVKYRLDYQGYKTVDYSQIKFYYDHGVHPTEIKLTLSVFSSPNILIIWCPHKNERIKHTFDQWINLFNSYELIVTEIIQPKPINKNDKNYLDDLFNKLNCKNKSLVSLSNLYIALFNKINNRYYDIIISFGLRFDIFNNMELNKKSLNYIFN